MYVVGTDEIAVRGGGVAPSGLAHAVDVGGEVLCRDERPRYQFPWLDWMGEATPAEAPDEARAAACPACTTIALERAMPAADDPYPTAARPATQPAIDWLRLPQDFSVWSAGL